MTSGVGATTEADVIRFIGSAARWISYGSCNRQPGLHDAVKRALFRDSDDGRYRPTTRCIAASESTRAFTL